MANREALAAAALAVLADVTGAPPGELPRIDVHHNYAAREEHLGRTVWVHRKGAIAAPEGALLEEAPAVYRDIGEVLEDEAELVTPLVRLESLVVLKG